ncbi:outer membrane protein assembly factor BamD [Olivibacter sitiensis]|uniref:outer membrane protein assembly factor BamD n=1 Tax=Olivibacter sitiensis TaxID=376470 RepID=UPI000489D34F|nr:outer membrane protein assembly factor BamD [Olivibacter sitiensis]
MFKNSPLTLGLIFVLLLSVIASGCKSRFEKLRLSNDNARKYREAINFYNKKRYSKALILFEDLANKYRGSAESEELQYYYAYTSYRLRDYTSARYQFKQFTDNFPQSARAEECRFMGAYCYYLESPVFSLDQDNTRKAIESLQLFINLYPQSDRAAEASKFIDDLRDKLERKAYANARLYLDIGDYQAAVIAFQNALRDYPDTKYGEEMEYLIIRAQYLYAQNSMLRSQEKRFNEAIGFYNDFLEAYPESKYRKDADNLKENSLKNIESVQKLIAAYTPKKIEEDAKEKQAEQEKENSIILR